LGAGRELRARQASFYRPKGGQMLAKCRVPERTLLAIQRLLHRWRNARGFHRMAIHPANAHRARAQDHRRGIRWLRGDQPRLLLQRERRAAHFAELGRCQQLVVQAGRAQVLELDITTKMPPRVCCRLRCSMPSARSHSVRERSKYFR
jgi:hypothetical protein